MAAAAQDRHPQKPLALKPSYSGHRISEYMLAAQERYFIGLLISRGRL